MLPALLTMCVHFILYIPAFWHLHAAAFGFLCFLKRNPALSCCGFDVNSKRTPSNERILHIMSVLYRTLPAVLLLNRRQSTVSITRPASSPL